MFINCGGNVFCGKCVGIGNIGNVGFDDGDGRLVYGCDVGVGWGIWELVCKLVCNSLL